MEEISLKEIIEILLKGKIIILITTLAALIVGAAVYMLMPEQYKTTVSILANPIKDVGTIENDSINQVAFPNMDILSYKQQFLNNYTIRKTIEELDIKDKEGDYIANDSIKSMITINNPDKTNILEVDVSGKDPEQITQMANVLGKYFIDYITDVYQTSAGVSANVLAEQLKIEESNLDREAARLRDYLKSSDNMDTLNTEISTLISQITQYKATLNDLERAIEADSISAIQLRERAGDVPINGDLQLSAVLTDGAAYTGSYQMNLDTGTANLEKMIFTLKLADVEARLLENINAKGAVENKINELQDRLSELQAKRAEEQYKYDAIQRDFERAESAYNTYSAQYKQALIIEAASLGNVNIKIISEAVIPANPYNKNLLLTGGIAGALGLFIGVFAALFRGYWMSEEGKTQEAETVKEYDTEDVRHT